MLEEMKLKDVIELIHLLKGQNISEASSLLNEVPKIEIVVLQRGWVVVGRFHKKDYSCQVLNGYVIRKWGTTKGLGQLALDGPTSDTVLDPIPTTKFHELTIVARFVCEESKWNSKIS